jgi:hypothetical protein
MLKKLIAKLQALDLKLSTLTFKQGLIAGAAAGLVVGIGLALVLL